MTSSGDIAFLNDEARKIFHHFPFFIPGENIHHQPWDAFYKNGQRMPQEEFPAIAVLRSGSAIHNVIFRLVNASGRFIWVDLNADPVAGKGQPEHKGVILTVQDISNLMEEKERLQEVEQEAKKTSFNLEMILHNTDEGFLITDDQLHVVSFNDAYRRIIKDVYNSEIKEGDYLIDLVATDQKEYVWSVMKKVLSGKKFETHRTVLHKGNERVFQTDIHPLLQEEKIIGIFLQIKDITVDITIQKQHELNMKKLNEDLVKQAMDLKQSNTDLERFAYVASHDLQEPLRMVSSFLSLIEKRYNHVLDDAGKKYIHFAVDGANRMKKLILDLLQFSRIGSTREKKEPVDTMQLCNSLLDEFVFTVNEKNARVEIGDLPVVLAYKSQLAHVFRNLLSNALKYSAGPPRVEIGQIDHEDFWEFYVKDNGIGIEEKYYEKIFVIFQQLHNKSKYSGTGIGLSIAKKIVEQHGGNFRVISTPGEGSTFYFSITKT
jgi:PAS domain S-box-containing protein